MSTTSTTFNGYRKRRIKGCESITNTTKNDNYAGSFRSRGDRDRDILLKKRSNEKLIDELSTFIAECSYLTDGQDSKPETPKNLIQSYNGYLVHSSENNESDFNKKLSNRPYRNNYDRRRESVEWIEQRKPYPDNTRKNVQFRNATSAETSELRRYYNPRDYDYVDKDFHRRKPNKRIRVQKHEDGNSYTRPRSKFKRQDNKEPVDLWFRGESKDKSRKLASKKVKKSKSKPRVRYWPFRYEKNKPKFRIEKYPLVKKENCIPWEWKQEILSESPTVITLYPKNARRKYGEATIDDLDFLADPDLTCKCLKCMRKYEQLQKIIDEKPTTLYCKPKNEFQSLSMGNEDIVSREKTLHKQSEQCDCKNKQRSSHTVIHPNKSNQVNNSSYRPQELKCATGNRNTPCCNTKKQRNHVSWNSPQHCDHCSMPTCQPYSHCLPKHFVEYHCRPYQLYEPYANLKCHALKPSPYPCDDENFLSNWRLNEVGSCDEQNGESCYKSVFFRFDCVGHQIDPVITKYFHSILNTKIH